MSWSLHENCPYSENSEYGHFSRSGYCYYAFWFFIKLRQKKYLNLLSIDGFCVFSQSFENLVLNLHLDFMWLVLHEFFTLVSLNTFAYI